MGRVPPHKDKEVSKIRLSCFFRSPQELAEVKEEYAKFSSCIEEFNDHDSIQDRWSSTPHSWWSNYGQNAPLLMSLAMKVPQPTSLIFLL
jgi:general stress protein 26